MSETVMGYGSFPEFLSDMEEWESLESVALVCWRLAKENCALEAQLAEAQAVSDEAVKYHADALRTLAERLVTTEAQLEAAQRGAKASQDISESLTGYARKVEAERDALRALVEKVEWVYMTGAYSIFARRDQLRTHQCPWCKEWKRDGHAPDCDRQAAIEKVRGDQ